MFQNFWILLEKGGVMMFPLSLCSLLALTVIIERVYALKTKRLLAAEVKDAWSDWLKQKPSSSLPAHSDALLQMVLEPLSGFLPLPVSRLEERFSDLSRKVRNSLEQGLVYLDTIAGVAPLLGLLGTALGMIRVFSQLSSTGTAKMEALSSGISEALFTTVTGLSIGIPALIAANLIARHIDNLMLQLEDDLNELVDQHGVRFVESP